ncbi:hypothetical protein B4U84_11045 [Westiellopsis prolifica IICB1]|nr:hypothetical protein B4U84_11045 [Westiellopsis prolifica IICB1]
MDGVSVVIFQTILLLIFIINRCILTFVWLEVFLNDLSIETKFFEFDLPEPSPDENIKISKTA